MLRNFFIPLICMMFVTGMLVAPAHAGALREPPGKAKLTQNAPSSPAPKKPTKVPASTPQRQSVIVIDAGHGGQDPGAIGPDGTQEKDITLSTALMVQKALAATGRYKVILTRDGDFFLKLRERVQLASKNGAALFISLHADTVGASSDPALTRGASIYTISDQASDEVSSRLAARENKADLLGAAASAAKGSVETMLLDLLSQETMNRSKTLAESILTEFESSDIPMLSRTHRSAGFAVLKGETFPSVLIEMGFISSEQDSERLRERAHQQRLAAAIARGVDAFMDQDKTTDAAGK